jgi:hypothetical protein
MRIFRRMRRALLRRLGVLSPSAMFDAWDVPGDLGDTWASSAREARQALQADRTSTQRPDQS